MAKKKKKKAGVISTIESMMKPITDTLHITTPKKAAKKKSAKKAAPKKAAKKKTAKKKKM